MNPQPIENDINRFTFLHMYPPGFSLLMFFPFFLTFYCTNLLIFNTFTVKIKC